jgi:hypothetical protein
LPERIMGMDCSCMGVGLLKPIEDKPSSSPESKLNWLKSKEVCFEV